MKEPTEQEKYFKTKRLFIISIAALFIIVCLLLVDRCNKGKEIGDAKTSYAKIEDALKNVLSQDKHVRKYADSLEKGKRELELNVADLLADREIIRVALIAESDKAKRLSLAVKKAKESKDTGAYITNCDSLSGAYFDLLARQWTQDSIDIEMHNVFRAHIRNVEAQRDNWRRGYDSCLSAVKTADNLLPDIKPKSKFYIDGKALFGAITGAGGGFSLVDTKGNKFSVTASATTSGPLYEATYGRLLNFKKRK
jgi:hypothetical protein